MVEFKDMTNEELVELAQNGVEYAADELFLKIEKLMLKYVNKYREKTPLNEEDLVECGYVAFVNSLRLFDSTKGWKFNTYYGSALVNEFARLINSMNRITRKANFEAESLNDKIASREDSYELQDLLVIEDDFSNVNIIDYQEGINYAMNLVADKYKPYILDLLFGNMTSTEVGKLLGKSHQMVSVVIKKFRQNVKDYVLHAENHRIIQNR